MNVRGEIMKVSKQILCKHEDSMLAAKFSGRFSIPTDPQGHILIDRDPMVFKQVLNFFLRNNSYPLIISEQFQSELDYWCLESKHLLVSKHNLKEISRHVLEKQPQMLSTKIVNKWRELGVV